MKSEKDIKIEVEIAEITTEFDIIVNTSERVKQRNRNEAAIFSSVRRAVRKLVQICRWGSRLTCDVQDKGGSVRSAMRYIWKCWAV